MSKVTKKELKKQLDGVQNRFAALVKDLKASGHICESVYAPFAHDYQKEQSDHDAVIAILDSKEPQLKQLDQSVFDGLDEKWRFAAVDQNAETNLFEEKPVISSCGNYWVNASGAFKRSVLHFDNSNWQNSLIERDTAKELLEVDLSSELTGSELVRAMLERGDRCVMCMVANNEANMFLATRPVVVHGCTDSGFISVAGCYSFAVAVNNQGEPLTASEVGL